MNQAHLVMMKLVQAGEFSMADVEYEGDWPRVVRAVFSDGSALEVRDVGKSPSDQR